MEVRMMALLKTYRIVTSTLLSAVFLVGFLIISPGDAFSLLYTTRVSVDSSGNGGNGNSFNSSISADGRYIVFQSDSNNLVAGDTNAAYDIFVHDRQTGETTRVSVDSSGNEANGGSYEPFISADGRYVVFDSLATNLVPGDTNSLQDIFIHDRQTGETTRISVDSNGNEANNDSFEPSLSFDGRFVLFGSFASNLVAGDTNNFYDIFVHDRQTGETTRINVDSSGNQANNSSYNRNAISSTGRYVAFASQASNLVPGDTNGKTDIFVHDMVTGETTRVSVNSRGVQGDNLSVNPSISADGRYIAFGSWSSNLVSGDTNDWWDVFVHDRLTGKTTRVSISSSGAQGNNSSGTPSISADGRFVVFSSGATNLVSGDSNKKNDIFVHDRQTRQTIRVNYSPLLKQGDNHSYEPFISPGGPYIVFESIATNLVDGDTNGARDIFVIYPPSVLLSPNGGEFIPSGSVHTITWQAVPIADTFKLKYSLDGGMSWNSIPGAKGIKGTSFDWTVPELSKNNSKCLVQLIAYDANGVKLGAETSDAPFTIGAVNLTAPSDPGISLTSGGLYDITWTTYTKAPVETVKLFYTLDDTAASVIWKSIQTFSGGVNPGIHSWTIPMIPKSKSRCRVKVVLKDSSGKTVGADTSDNTFTIMP